MYWEEDIVLIPKFGYKRAIVRENGEIVELVDCLDKNFVKKIIDTHNKAIDRTMEIWVKEGVKIAKGYK